MIDCKYIYRVFMYRRAISMAGGGNLFCIVMFVCNLFVVSIIHRTYLV